MNSIEIQEELGDLPYRRDDIRPEASVNERIQEILVEHAGYEEDDFRELTEEKLAGMDPHLLFAWCDDHDGVSLGAIPESAIGDEQNEWLEALGPAVFVGAADFDPAGFAALMRIMALIVSPLGVERSDVIGLWPWFEREAGRWSDGERAALPTLDELKALDGRWSSYLRASMKQRFSRALAIRKST